ncbi:hypothetical protein B7R78_0017065 [Ralstonia solanacearum]|uniref:Transmembrane protein n=1 Tax=Ralstonia solanacearum K60 TaxID=1091042 RepID=A0AAP7ZPI1_RALSL|nr:hypothetical protein [Ralstonia solanacearum]MBT1538755.1 hypothetical protein [Ralstonia solanacearum]OYQ14367.1 hypothetical protein B7R77_14625 [Ralstonia solanacearum K60]QOK81738.1 hypothetical protein HF906_05935 [Ralstonia solanacearum]RIJ85799.1 hypothetical protein RSP822_13400 [Ralstonia solanacearum]CCF98780.1 conserved exported hypothetical protein [Ralstonia solanacearum K60]
MNRSAAFAVALTMAALAGCAGTPQAEGGKPAAFARTSHRESPYLPMKVPGHAMFYYGTVGGVDELSVRLTASGNLIRLSYRVIDPAVAKVLADKNITPYLFGPRSGALLQVPAMDTVGQLRQVGQLEPGRSYWMVFSNKGNLIKPGDRVSVLAGAMHIDGLMVE